MSLVNVYNSATEDNFVPRTPSRVLHPLGLESLGINFPCPIRDKGFLPYSDGKWILVSTTDHRDGTREVVGLPFSGTGTWDDRRKVGVVVETENKRVDPFSCSQVYNQLSG